MALSDVLDEIQGDAKIDDPVIENKVPENQEQLDGNENADRLPVLLAMASEMAKEAHCSRVISEAIKSSTISKTTALEIFTMLPVVDLNKNMLTEAASSSNQRLISTAYSGKIGNNQSLITFKNEISELLTVSIVKNKDTVEKVVSFLAEVNSQLTRLKERPPIIIIGKEAFNILTGDLYKLYGVDDSSLDYLPYRNILVSKLLDLVLSVQNLGPLSGFPTVNDAEVSSLLNISVCFMQKCKNYLHNFEDTKILANKLGFIGETDGSIYPEFEITQALNTLVSAGTDDALFGDKGSVGVKTLDCLSFLV